ncbi:hypothetical protein CDES_03945 [Corynebacterium deserti GIMN1.010]|uniref:Bacteriocin biosynthesis cyclodehydratase domain-containing protein n=1 Tax=Corynebacterium deserti GIMN1.010 TaxID=931089 RepID=A0A0M4CCZ0_9CORY|nr:hypothetical protein [Corynebacterium deserti]ALC05241.1 hypothetical protein CDES_03945 [Corynebacterium deserti GIMN1.010]
MTHISLANSAQVLFRSDSSIQFGVDATRAGVIGIDASISAAVVTILRNLRTARPLADVVADLRGAGLAPTAALTLIDDLLGFGILRESPTAQVLILGSGTLVDATAFLLETYGFAPRLRHPSEDIAEVLDLSFTHTLVINRLAHSQYLAPLLKRRAPTYLQAAIVDSRGQIGPGRRNGSGPCLLCVDLHRCDIDPEWTTIVKQQPDGPTFPDPITELGTAARLVSWVIDDSWTPGAIEEVDPHNGTNHRSTLSVHPRCPICYR